MTDSLKADGIAKHALNRWNTIRGHIRDTLAAQELTLSECEQEQLYRASRAHWATFRQQFSGTITCAGPPGEQHCRRASMGRNGTPHSYRPWDLISVSSERAQENVTRRASAHMHIDHQPSVETTVRELGANMRRASPAERQAWWEANLPRIAHRLYSFTANHPQGWPAALSFRCGPAVAHNYDPSPWAEQCRRYPCHPMRQEQRRLDRLGGVVQI